MVAGRLTLREAAERFRKLDDGDILPRTNEGVAGEEALCLNVVAYAGYASRDDPGRDRRRDPALDRLRQEYLGLFGRGPGGFLLCECPRPAGSAD